MIGDSQGLTKMPLPYYPFTWSPYYLIAVFCIEGEPLVTGDSQRSLKIDDAIFLFDNLDPWLVDSPTAVCVASPLRRTTGSRH